MKTITIDIIAEPTVQHVSNSKGGYDSLEIPFKDNGKVSGKKLNSLFQKEVFAKVKEFQRGDRIEVDLEKETGSDGKEYWQWKAVRKLDGESSEGTSSTPTQAQESKAPVSNSRGGKVLGSTYETPEERALKQVLIVRQSSFTSATEFLKATQGDFSLAENFAEAEKINRWVFDNGRLVPPALNVPAKADTPEVADKDQPVEATQETPKRKGRPPATKKVEEMDDDIPF